MWTLKINTFPAAPESNRVTLSTVSSHMFTNEPSAIKGSQFRYNFTRLSSNDTDSQV